jgi:CPA2 family monovalent cation:H+ antiporter-2
MHTAELLRDIVLLLAASLPIVFLFQRIRVPALVGFLIAGVIVGPSATGLVRSTETADVLAEVGVVLLLFTIGLEVSLTELSQMRRVVLTGGTAQVLGTIGVAAGAALAAGYPPSEALVLGFLLALSSTAIVLKLLADRGELEAPHGRIALGVLLFQDLCIVPMMLLLPVLGRPQELSAARIAATLGAAFGALVAIFYGARIVLPALLRRVLRLRIRELFVGTVVLICLGTAWLTAQLGLSLAIGAFVAGLVISESEYSHQVVAEILPLRDLLNSVFFISIGMLLDVRFVVANALAVAVLVLVVLLLKACLAAAAVWPFTRSARLACLVGIALSQIGEFSFVLAGEASRAGVLGVPTFQIVLTVTVITMLASPFLIAAAPVWTGRFAETVEVAPPSGAREPIAEHVLIIGYGLNGRNLARVLRETGLPYRVLDLNAEAVRVAQAAGESISFGDATRAVVLRHVGAKAAAVVVVAISDPRATRRVVSTVRELNPTAALIVRTRFVSEIEELTRLGADEVIPEEFETSVEIFARVLRRMHVPRNVIAMQIDLIRGESYAMLRGRQLLGPSLDDLRAILEASTIETYLLLAGSPAAGQSIGELQLRRRTGVTVIAVVHHGQSITNPSPELRLHEGDVLVMIGSHAELAEAMSLLAPRGADAVF